MTSQQDPKAKAEPLADKDLDKVQGGTKATAGDQPKTGTKPLSGTDLGSTRKGG